MTITRAARAAPRWLVGLSLLSVSLVSIPLVYVVWRAVDVPLSQFTTVLMRPRVQELTVNTLGLSLAVALSALVLGVVIAALLSRVRFRTAASLLLISALPLAVPSYLASYGWLVAIPGLNGFVPSWLLLTAVTVPYVTLPVAAALRGTSAEGEAVARTLGLGPLRAFVDVT